MAPPLVSVVLPVYDAAPWLDEALTSLEKQTLPDFEVLVQDDGSTDASAVIAKRHARQDDRIRVETQPHRGIVAALQAAATRGQGELLVRMDADDVSTPQRLERLVAASRDHPQVQWFSSRVRYVPPEGVGPGMRRYEAWVNGLLSHEEIYQDRFVECPLPHPTWAIRREAFDALGGYHDGDFPEDYELFLRACQQGLRFTKLPEVLLHWREGSHRLCRNDPRYALPRFFDLKLRFLLPRLRRAGRPVVVVGAGAWGKRWGRALCDAGVSVRAYLDNNPRRVGERLDGVPVHAASDLEPVGDAFLLIAVGRPGGRAEARAGLTEAGFQEEEETFLCVQ